MPISLRLFLLSSLAAAPSLLANGLQAVNAPAPDHDPSFERDARPIFKRHCFQCHGEGEKLKGGVDLRLRRFTVLPDEDGKPFLIPGDPEKSELIKLVREGEMPKKAAPLKPEEIAILENWVRTGAKTLHPEPETVPKFYFTEEERNYWAFQPISHPAVPKVKEAARVRTPVDAFLLQALEAKGLTFSPEADPETLIRRVSIDLTGLPPTPDEVDLFLADTAPDAYERMVERYLASPHYGERWGRHWLDVAGYADSDGYSDVDPVRPWAYKYRDYVIRSINADKPFDRFIREQLAGDELAKVPWNLQDLDTVEKLTATGFLRMVPDGTAGAADQTVARNAVVAETIKVVSSSLLGITVGCAQCHDHRLDPVPQADYYRMRAIFEPALNTVKWRIPAARLVSLMSPQARAEFTKIEAEAKANDDTRARKQEQYIGMTLEMLLSDIAPDLQEPLRLAYQTEVAKRTPEQVKLLKANPTIMNLSGGSLYLYDRNGTTKYADELKKMAEKSAEIRKRRPVEEFIPVLSEAPGVPAPATFLFNRGDPGQPKEQESPGELTILASFRKTDLPEKQPGLASTGRRLAFAKDLTDGTHPLTTRVLVNRVWYHHFGKGLVGSLGDFGHLGETPSHPELLDWLAQEFVRQGWSLKQMHRLMVCSTAYRQVTTRDGTRERIDPDNRLLSRANIRRLEAETIRDGMLVASGKLNPKMFGAPVPIMTDENGQIVLGVDTNDTAGRPSGKFVPLNGEEFRRSLYVQNRRSKPVGMLETFDMPRMEPNCELRNVSTVAPQSLAMMNGEFTLDQAKYLAERVVREEGPALEAQVKRAWRLALAADPSATELKNSLAFLQKQTEHFKEHPVKLPPPGKGHEAPPADPASQALTTFCQALLTSNAFLYVD
jgi:mono/diheme cytochrome c family protein